MAPVLNDGDILRVVNRGSAPVKVMYDSRTYTLAPEVDQFLPFAAVALWFGDPRAAGAVGSMADDRGLRVWVPDRETEVRRLRAKYDNQMGDETLIVNHPKVEVYTLDGERVYTVLDDPAGDLVLPATPTVADERDLRELVSRQQQQIETLMGIVSAQVTAPGAPQPPTGLEPLPQPEPPAPEGAPTDSPTEAPTSPGVVPEPPQTDVPPTPTMPPAPMPTESSGRDAPLVGTPLLPTTPQPTTDSELPPTDQG